MKLSIYLPSLLALTAGVIWLVSAIGYTMVGISGLSEYFQTDQSYWTNRLLASQLTGTTLFALVSAITFMASYLVLPQKSQSKIAVTLLALSAAVGAITIVELLLLTPSDASHAIPFAAAMMLTVGAIVSRLVIAKSQPAL